MARQPSFTNAEIALAMELRTTRTPWKLIARHLGGGIKDAVNYAKKHGMQGCARTNRELH